jgi:hypothetical protein
MKRSALVRRTPLRRVTALRPRARERVQRSSTAQAQAQARLYVEVGGEKRELRHVRKLSAYAARPRFAEYMLWVKSLPCLMSGVWGRCLGHVEADHAGSNRGQGRKAHDSTVIPMCQAHHSKRFPDAWTHLQRRAWLSAAVAYVQARARAWGVPVPEGAQGSDAERLLSLADAWGELQCCIPHAA